MVAGSRRLGTKGGAHCRPCYGRRAQRAVSSASPAPRVANVGKVQAAKAMQGETKGLGCQAEVARDKRLRRHWPPMDLVPHHEVVEELFGSAEAVSLAGELGSGEPEAAFRYA